MYKYWEIPDIARALRARWKQEQLAVPTGASPATGSSATTTANVGAYRVPLGKGSLLRRQFPVGHPLRRRRRRD